MPDGDGYEFIDLVRQPPPKNGGLVPAIAISAAENTRAALMAGLHVLVAKPFDWLDIADTIVDFT